MEFTATVRQGYLNLWIRAKVLPEHKAALEAICRRFIANRLRYEAVEEITGVPWWWIACVHERESSCDFATHLANGDPLDEPTVHVPSGRGPFRSWEDGAIDALQYKGLHHVKDWSLPSALYWFEAYNGWGYVAHGVNSAYVWSFTDQYHGGKYIADRVFSYSAFDTQPGCAAMLNVLLSLIPNLITQVLPPMTTPAPTPNVTIPASASNVVVNPLAQLGLALLSVLGGAFTSHQIDVGGVITAMTGGSFWGGILATVVPLVINHYLTKSSNKATLAALMPQQTAPTA